MSKIKYLQDKYEEEMMAQDDSILDDEDYLPSPLYRHDDWTDDSVWPDDEEDDYFYLDVEAQ